MQTDLFSEVDKGAEFSNCRNYRYALWRIWDKTKPLVMFIGLNPSTADETKADNTISRVKAISEYNGFGGFYMMNCFPFVSTDPKELFNGITPETQENNNKKLIEIGAKCKGIVFSWGNFKEVDRYTVKFLYTLFPNAKALRINKNGSPKHPLYCKKKTKLINFNQPLNARGIK